MPIAVDRLESARAYIPNLRYVSDSLARGGQPQPQGLKALQDAGINIIINLRGGSSSLVSLFRKDAGLPEAESPELQEERILCRQLGMQFVAIPLDVFGNPPLAAIDQFVQLVSESNRQPAFVHCLHGCDRTGLMTAAYRIMCENWTVEQAYTEMVSCGFDPQRKNLSDALYAYVKNRSQSDVGAGG
jgi:protein tyrosine/serine phosphatase